MRRGTAAWLAGLAVAAAAGFAEERRHSVPLLGAAEDRRQGFVRLVNRSDAAGAATVWAIDDAGERRGPVTLSFAAKQALHFNSNDLQRGNVDKGIEGVGPPSMGDWRLEVASELDLEVVAYLRTTPGGFLTSMRDVAPEAGEWQRTRRTGGGQHRIAIFNPGSNADQRSRLRLVNAGAEAAAVTISGVDDAGRPGVGEIRLALPGGQSRTLDADDMEAGDARLFRGALGDGEGKWRLTVSADRPILVMSLLDAKETGLRANLSTAPANAEASDGATTHRVPLFPPKSHPTRQGFLRVANHSLWAGAVHVTAVDDEGVSHPPVTLTVAAGRTVHFNSTDLEDGNAAKGLSGGVGDGDGNWRLALRTSLDVDVMAYIRTRDGFLASIHDVAPRSHIRCSWWDNVNDHCRAAVPIFNPARNARQKSALRLVNDNDEDAAVTITGTDDAGRPGAGPVRIVVPAKAATTLSAADLELGTKSARAARGVRVFEESWDGGAIDPAKWVEYGQPRPLIVRWHEGRYNVFDNNGDENHGSGAVTAEGLELGSGEATISADVYVDFYNPAGCWADAEIGLTRDADVQTSVTGVSGGDGIAFTLAVEGAACGDTPSEHRRRAWFRGGMVDADGSWERMEPYTMNGDDHVGGWHEMRIVVDASNHVSFHINGAMLWRSAGPLDPALRSGRKLKLGARSSGSAGKAYIDNVSVVTDGAVGDRFRDCAQCPEMAVLPAGTFMVKVGGRAQSFPLTIAPPFAVGVHEVTFAEWDACVIDGGCGYWPDSQGWGRGNRPVIHVNWDDAKSYAQWLSEKTGKRYRLLSESEWEYAARAGADTAYSWGSEVGENRANCQRCGSQWDNRSTAPVGSFAANAWGLHDMHGNVQEWTEDCGNRYVRVRAGGGPWVSGQCGFRALRGGSWRSSPDDIESESRSWDTTTSRSAYYGFRVARMLVPDALGTGQGKWRLTVEYNRPISVMSLLESPAGHLTNLSAGTIMGPFTTGPFWGQISNQSSVVGRVGWLDLADYFLGTPRSTYYRVRSSDTSVLQVTVTNGVLRLTSVSTGSATVTVTGLGRNGYEVGQTFTVTVEGPEEPGRAYTEDFESDPGFTRLASSPVYFWDVLAGNYRVRTRNDRRLYSFAYSPHMGLYSDAVTVEIDVLLESQERGAQPSVYFYRHEPNAYAVGATSPDEGGIAAWSISFNWTNQQPYRPLSIRSARTEDGNRREYSVPVEEDVWYRVRVAADGRGRADLRIVERGGRILYEEEGVDFPMGAFAYLGVGYYDEPDGDDAVATIRIDNLSVRSGVGWPEVTIRMPDRFEVTGRDGTLDLSEHFTDNQTLTYRVRSSSPDVLRVSVTGSVLTLMPVSSGGATVTVTARDPDGKVATQTFSVAVRSSQGLGVRDRFRDCDVCPEMVVVPAGTFMMGAPESEVGSLDRERPVHAVSVPSFAVGVYEVTFAEWDACLADGGCDGYRPDFLGWGGRGRQPVSGISWDHAQTYVEWLSSRTGERYRLPSESEWEYVARAGTTTPFHTGATITADQANYDRQHSYPNLHAVDTDVPSPRKPVPVGSFGANAWGLHDVHGNVEEMTEDCMNWNGYDGAPSDGSAWLTGDCDFRVTRGGAWLTQPVSVRAAARGAINMSLRFVRHFGFRVARTLTP